MALGQAMAALAVGGIALVPACSDGKPQQPAPRSSPVPRTVDLATIADRDLRNAVLDECHKPLRGRMDRVAATVCLADGTELHLFAMLPDKLRVVANDGTFLLRGDDVYRLGDPAPGTATPAETARIRLLRTLLDAATLSPLHRATGCRRLPLGDFELAEPEGPAWMLRLRDATLLPAMLSSSHGQVRILDYLRTSSTWIVKKAELDGLGVCVVRFDQSGLDWTPDFFALPTEPKNAAGTHTRIAAPGSGGAEPQSPTPFLANGLATRWVCVADAGDWTARVAAYKPLHEELVRQDQLIPGFPMFWQEDGKRWLAAPFRQRAGGKPFTAPKDWRIRDVPAGRWLVVYPPDGDLEHRLAAGERLLRDALAAQGLTALGAILAQPFFHLQEGEPAAEKLAAPVVRMSVPVR